MAELLFKLVYGLSKHLGSTTLYIVLEHTWLRILNRHFLAPFAPMGTSHIYPDGTETIAASVTCETLEQSMLQTAPDKYVWYRAGIVAD